MLPWWVIGFSIVGSNIAATDYVGGAGGAYRFGVVQASFDWIGAAPAIVLSALLFVPYYWKAGVYTVPEFLGRRYNEAVRIIQTILWSAFMVFSMGLYFWASGLMLEGCLGIPTFWGFVVTAAIVGTYTVFGGLAAVAMTDVVQLLVMFIGGVSLTVLGLWHLGGLEQLGTLVREAHPEHLHLLLPTDHGTYPWPAVILGLGFVAAPAWWCCNQAMIQRTLGARSEWDARAGMLFAAFPRMVIPVMTVVPGLIALVMHPGFVDGDMAYPWLIKTLLPAGLSGLVLAAILAALISSADSTLNSIATLLTKDIYQKYLVPGAPDRHYLTVGRIMTAVFVVIAVFIAPTPQYFAGIFVAGATMLGIFQGPTFAVSVLGIYWRRVNQWGGLAGMLGGLVISGGMYAYFGVEGISFFYVVWWSFVGSIIATVAVSLLTRPDPLEKLEGLVYGLVMQDGATQGRLARRAGEGGA
jgi:SSS family solute:Na+ symporter